MGLLDRFRKKEEVNLEELGIKEEPEFKPAFPEAADNNLSKSDVELIITKLDLINQRLENMDRRLQVIEKAAKEVE